MIQLKAKPLRLKIFSIWLLCFFVACVFYLHGSDLAPWVSEAPENRKIAIACMSTKETPYDYMSLSNKFTYVKKHGYHMEFDWFGDGYWHKLDIVERLVAQQQYDWIWCIDYDTLITNTTIKLEDLIEESLATVPDPNQVDFMFTGDCFPLNAGSMLFRSNTYVASFLSRAKACRHKPLLGLGDRPSEQDCMRQLIMDNKHGENEHALFIPQWKMNAFPEEIPCYDKDKRKWEPGMFVVHFAGAWAHMPGRTDAKADLFKKYHPLVDAVHRHAA